MDRRGFIKACSGAIAMVALSGCERQHEEAKSKSAGAKEITAAEFHSTRKFVSTDQGRIAYVERGNGPAAIFLHGFPLNSFQWRGVIPRLSGMRRCIAPDFLALGYTEVADGQSVAPLAQVDMLVQLLDRLSISAIDMVANDSGGAIAQLFAARCPERVRSL